MSCKMYPHMRDLPRLHHINLHTQHEQADDDDLHVHHLRTGDMIFFHSETLPAEIIQLSGLCRWSHVGLVVTYYSCVEHTWTQRLGLWESVNSSTHQRTLIDGELRTGVRLVDLMERLHQQPPGTVGVRRLLCNSCLLKDRDDDDDDDESERDSFESRLRAFIMSENGKPYEQSIWTLLLAWLDCGNDGCPWFNNSHDTSAYFCSELVAESLLVTGLLLPNDTTRPPSSAEFTVANLANLNGNHFPGSHLGPGINYQPMRILTWD